MRAPLPCVSLVLCLASFAAAPRAQVVVTTPQSPQMRFVDFHEDLAHEGVVVAVGRLDKLREGKRERLENGQLGGNGAVTVISGTQFFKVPVTATLRPQVVFGDGDDPARTKPRTFAVQCELQLARLPDGSEQRQSRTGNGAPVEAGRLALFVLAPGDKERRKKGLELLHVIAFDQRVDQGPDGEAAFVDAMRDFYVVNRHVADLEAALAAADAAPAEGARREAALTRLQVLTENPPTLRRPENDTLFEQHVGPLAARAQKRLSEAKAAKPAAEGAGEGGG